MKNYALLIIDADNDFVDPQGSLFVKGADTAIHNLASWIDYYSDNIKTVFCSLDSHDINHIGFSNYWKKGPNGTINPEPFMQLTIDDITKGFIVPKDSRKLEWVKIYLGYLKSIGQKHILWPYHSIDGTWGQAMPKYLTDVFLKKKIDPKIIRKGDYPDCEMYSIFEYAYPIMMPNINIPDTKNLMRMLLKYDKIIITGVAKDYCVSSTIASFIANFPKEILKDKFIFLRDAMATINPQNESLKIYDYCVKELGAVDCLLKDYEFE